MPGMYYFRRKAYDSASCISRTSSPSSRMRPMARDAGLRLIEAYKAIRYKEDASELCAQMTLRYSNDREVASICSGHSQACVDESRLRLRPASGKPPGS
jgi:hypothetical protein